MVTKGNKSRHNFKIEITLIQKLIKKKVREDIKKSDERIKEILENTESLQELKKKWNEGKHLIVKLRNEKEQTEYNREKITEVVKYYEKLYQEKETQKESEKRDKYEYEEIPKFMKSEIEVVIKKN